MQLSFIPDGIYIKRERDVGTINVQGFFVLINEGQVFVVWDEGSLRPVVLIFILTVRVSSKRTVLSWFERWPESVLGETLKRERD